MAETREQETCGAPRAGTYAAGAPVLRCELPAGHEGRHMAHAEWSRYWWSDMVLCTGDELESYAGPTPERAA